MVMKVDKRVVRRKPQMAAMTCFLEMGMDSSRTVGLFSQLMFFLAMIMAVRG